MSNNELVEQVKTQYAAVARSGLSSERAGVRAVARAFGYSPEQLAAVPAEATMGLSCGNPVSTAHLKPGEVVVDLGCGGGIDVLLASLKVGPTGKAIGIDMTPAMIERAVRNAVQFGKGEAPANVHFHLSQIEELPLPEGSVDCLISNCVINLAPDKPAVFREMFRVLKPGGRVAVCDIALKRPLPPEIGEDVLAYVGCVAGAVLITDYERMLREAGFQAVEILDTKKDLGAYAQAGDSGCCGTPAGAASCCSFPAGATEQAGDSGCCGTPGEATSCCSSPTGATEQGPVSERFHEGLAELLARYDVNDYAASVQVYAIKA